MLEIIKPKLKSLGANGLPVRRLLPSIPHQSIGPFIFLDHMRGQASSPPVDVSPHPHIGLATVTYLLNDSTSILHRDSLGTVQQIKPADINYMVAGRGIVHSEHEVLPIDKSKPQTVHGIQFWCALPIELEECNPKFQHVPKDQLPEETIKYGNESAHVRLLIGDNYNANYFGLFGDNTSPVQSLNQRSLYASLDFIRSTNSSSVGVPIRSSDAVERAVYAIDEDGVEIVSVRSGQVIETVPKYHLGVLKQGIDVYVRAPRGLGQSRAIVLGGEKLDRHRNICSVKNRIEEAKDHWEALAHPESFRNVYNQRFSRIPHFSQSYSRLP
ncbi:hypothetical protein HK096_000772 [Nowakowskiella sp. JEL0078]|nr:hypothetical protein HK096_000772 [Nowakowskiella sp. JEL0078]